MTTSRRYRKHVWEELIGRLPDPTMPPNVRTRTILDKPKYVGYEVVIDVYPDDYPNPDPNPKEIEMGGYQQLVRCEVMRGKFRNSFEKPEPFTPYKPTRVRFKLPDIAHGFRKGHRIMVQVQSSWFPLVDRNPQKFVDIYSAKEADFQKATQRVYSIVRQGVKTQRARLAIAVAC